MNFQNLPAVHAVEKGDSVYADIINHCRAYRSYLVAGSKTSSAHECTHGINADIRNGASCELEITRLCDLPKRRWLGRVNGFYVRQNRAAVVPEPAMRKRDAVEFIPAPLRGPRYSLYVSGQAEWDDSPLYLYDEWVAYVNNAVTAVDLVKRGELKAGGTDECRGAIEFVAYATGVLMAADKRGLLESTLVDFSRFHLGEAFDAFFAGRELFPFGGQEENFANLLKGECFSAQRAFLQAKVGFAVPPGPGAQPLPKDLFKVV